MKSKKLSVFLTLASILILSGCVTRTYSVSKDRIDQNLNSGNRGFLKGKAPAQDETTRKDTRTIQVFEFELGRSYKAKEGYTAVPAIKTDEIVIEETFLEPEASVISQKYTVGKNDTLQKISKKFYGTTRNWTKIYEANQDVLKGPDKVYPGQTLNIPDVGQRQPAAERLSEPKENLK
ncbi:MAG: LysM peptidoglycan-binding domain-containing protein [Candidatus Omnitrophica bacterium]|nr:LysM peptidoglycan-binding domain-containing protein [Candidatus Omnitrophota bacterium]MDD5027195.1 LysM peptidoglycan-binding domain-containing protein [Candidatus Omnitrophota bacterium]MDD5662340.1 LysM peptidoglycan-binding domain-containing protein [Candidatus Omnitrophota bacterium]